MLKKGVTISICLLTSFNSIIIFPDTVNVISTPVVEIKWAEGQEVQEVDVSPCSNGFVTFSGTFSADLAAGSITVWVHINIISSTNMGWPATVTPSTVILNPGCEEKAFCVTVQVTHGLNIKVLLRI